MAAMEEMTWAAAWPALPLEEPSVCRVKPLTLFFVSSSVWFSHFDVSSW